MAKGRKPKPTAIKKIDGNRGRRPMPENEPQPEKGRPAKPLAMGSNASRLWDDLSDELYGMGVLTTVDGLALRMLCENWERFLEARRIVNAYGSMTYETQSTGGILIKVNPAVGIMERADRAIRGWCSEFGLTPAARSRVEKALDDGEEDEIESFFASAGQAGPNNGLRN